VVPPKPSDPSGRLTASQQLIWAGQKLSPDSPLYNMAIAVSIEGPLVPSVFAEAFRRLVGRSDALRSVFVDVGGVPMRRVLPEDAVAPLPVIGSPQSSDAIHATVIAAAQRPFAPEGLLFDAALFTEGPGRSLFFLNQHHLITDAWSTGALYRQLGDLYRDVLEDRHESPGRLPSFETFVEYEAAERRSRRYEKAAAYWRESSADVRRGLRYYGTSVAGTHGRTERIRRRLDKDRTTRLRARAEGTGVAALTAHQALLHLFAALLAGWAHRVADVPRVSIGTPYHNRARREFRDMQGLFMELLPVRIDVDGTDTLAQLLRKASEAAYQTMRHAVPGCSLLPATRDFEIVLNVIRASIGDFAGLPATSDWIHSGYGDPAHALRLQVYDFDQSGEITLDFDLAADVFSDLASEWAVDHFMRLLEAFLADPETPLAAVTLTTWDEAASFMPCVGIAAQEPWRSVNAMFRDQVKNGPAAVAVSDGNHGLTYGELGAMVDAARSRLVTAGAGLGTTVAVCVEHSAALIAAWLGILEAGAAFLPLDPRHPAHRNASVARDGGAAIVIVDDNQAGRTPSWEMPALSVDDLFAPCERQVPLPGEPPQPGQIAYVLYTSGSTGAPKGVEVTHASLADYVQWAARVYACGEPLAFALFTSPAFDLTLTSVFVPLVSGGSILVYRQTSTADFTVRRVFEDDRADVVKLTPSHLALVRDLPLDQSRVRRLIVGGEDFKTDLAADIAASFARPIEIINEYGPTEATVGCMIHVYWPDRDTDTSLPIGVPAEGTAIYVLDAYDRPAPRGISGEICIAGVRVARGYRGRPEETAIHFTDDPRQPGTRMYRTGDCGRWRADGNLEFLGRRDAQVKVRGVRIELGEIEARLAQHPALHQAVAVLANAGVGDELARCRSCGLEGQHPDARLDAEQLCTVCRGFEHQRENVRRYFGTMKDLARILTDAKTAAGGRYDALMLFSGGKDSTFALCSLVEMGVRPLVFLLDNGYISDQAKENVRRVVDMLALDLHVASTPAMPQIFADSLRRYSNVCNGCFKTIYTLATQVAIEQGIPLIVTGLSRGQIFETRLAEMYRRGITVPEEIDRTVREARKAYHRMDDAVSRTLDCSMFSNDEVFEQIRFVDFYRYCDTPLDEMLGYLAARTPWLRPSDTGRSTNCLINEVGISVHKAERGFHNYALPYSWDVRLGHKLRDAAIEELDDPIDPARVQRILRDVGYRPRPRRSMAPTLVAYYVAEQAVPAGELRQFLEERIPLEAVPAAFVRLDAPPLTANGKIDRRALATARTPDLQSHTRYVAPHTAIEKTLARIWAAVLGTERIGVDDDFFELGGDSIQCIQILAEARTEGLIFTARDLFSHPTVATLAHHVGLATKGSSGIAVTGASDAEMAELLHEFGDDGS